jgi:hypothetical protein
MHAKLIIGLSMSHRARLLSMAVIGACAGLAPTVGHAQVTFLNSFGSAGTGSGQFKGPYGVAVDGSGNVYVADTFNNRVEVFNASGAFQSGFGSLGNDNGQFDDPSDVTVGASGNVYVTDIDNDRVEVFNASGVFQSSFGSTGSGQLNGPYGVAVGGTGNVYVTDYNNQQGHS